MIVGRHRLCVAGQRRARGVSVIAAVWVMGLAIHAHAEDKNGVGPHAVVLPSGPGSIQGLGANFEPNENTGVAEYEYRLATPAGTAGMQPDLALSYQSGSGNGPLGIGWELSIPFVQRETVMVLPRYIDADNGVDDDRDGVIDNIEEQDRFVSELHEYPEALVPGEDGYYLGEKEGPFVRYRRVGEHWEGNRPDGVHLWFGETEQARVIRPDIGAAFTWKLEREEDLNGNTIRYSYSSFPGDENLNTTYLTRIEYGPGRPPWDNFHFIVFEYEKRPGFFEKCFGGFPERIGMRLKEILVCTQGPALEGHAAGDFNGDGVADYLNHRYLLAYEAHPYWTLLTSITEFGADGVSSLPPLTMKYTVCDPPPVLSAAHGVDGKPGIINSSNTPPVLFTNSAVEITELNGDGLPDLLRTYPEGGAHTAYLNLGESGEETDRRIQWSNATPIGGDPLVYNVNLSGASGLEAGLSDLNADTRADLEYRAGPRELYYFPNEVVDGVPVWGARTAFNLDPAFAAPPTATEDNNVLEEDMNGDVGMDIVQSLSSGGHTQLRIWLNRGGEGYARPLTVDEPFTYQFSDEGVDLTDFNGDTIPDMVRITPTHIEVAAGLGYGRFASVRNVAIPGGPLNQVHVQKAVLEEVTSSGLPDLLIENASAGELWYWVNLGNYTLDQKRVITDLPVSMSENAATRWADLNGNGTSDVIYADDRAAERLRVVDIGQLIGCVPSPNLLTFIDNGMGARTEIEYTTSVEFQCADRQAGVLWQDPMPAPVDVVSAVTTDDSLGHRYTRNFVYHDGFFSSDFLEFIGFGGREEHVLSSDPSAPPSITRYGYDVGREEFALRGALLHQSVETADGAVFWEEQTDWDVRTVLEGINDTQAIFPHPVSRVRRVLEGGAGTPKQMEWEFEYDDYGNETVNRAFGVVEGDDRGALGDERIEETEYAVNDDLWLIRLPSRQVIRDLEGNILAKTEYYYDDETFSGQNSGETVRGLQTLERRWRDLNDPEGYVESSRVKYDGFGNPILLLDPLAQAPGGALDETAGHFRRIGYDPLFHVYPVREEAGVGGGKAALSLEAAYDYGFGAVLSYSDFNGQTTTYGYDVFSRLIHSILPGDTESFPTMEYEYGLAAPFGDGVVNYVETRLLDKTPVAGVGNPRDYYGISRGYVDGFGRILQKRREAEPATGTTTPRVAVSEAVLFNGRGGTAAMLQPFFSQAAGNTLDELLAYEDLEADGWAGRFHADGNLVSKNLADAPKTATAYDAEERPVKTTNPDGSYRAIAYEPLLTVSSDENDVTDDPAYSDTPTKHHFDGLGRLVQVDEIVHIQDDGSYGEALNTWTTRYAWRHDGRLTRITDSQNNQKWFEYDGLGRKVLMNDADQGETSYIYDDGDNLVRTVDAMNRVIAYTFDGANRILTEDYQDETEPFSAHRAYDPALPMSDANQPDAAYYYDVPAGPTDMGNGTVDTASGTAGRLAYVIDLSGETHFSYDARGNVAWMLKRLPDPIVGVPVSYRTAMTYDSMGRLTELTYPDEDRCAYAYNERNLLARITGGASANLNGGTDIVSGAVFAPSEQRIRYGYGDGAASTYGYDARGRLTSLRTIPSTGPDGTLIDYAYVYDGVSNLTGIRDNRPGTIRPAGDPRRNSQTFQYDSLYRLTDATLSKNLPGQPFEDDGQIRYRYDRIGNMLMKSSAIEQEMRGFSVTDLGDMAYGGEGGASNRIGRAAADPPGPHALTSAAQGDLVRDFQYDARGNITQMDGMTLTWDYKDRLAAVDDAAMHAEYVYDYTDRRVIKKVWERNPDGSLPDTASRTTQYIDKHFEIRDNGQPTKYVFDGDRRLAKVTGSLDAGANRVQRLRLSAGWNLVVLAVDASDAAAQLGIGASEVVEAAFKWDAASGDYVALDAQSELPAGAIFWLSAAEAAVIPVRGKYTEPINDRFIAATGYLLYAGLERLNLETLLRGAIEQSWAYSGPGQTWQARLPGDLAFLSDLPPFIQPGQPVYLAMNGQTEVTLPPAAARIQYYHEDHLGSANVVTDAHGEVFEETAFYPFGEIRHQFHSSADEPVSPNRYLFSQKERDEETDLQYFEARYLVASLGRFNRVDPAVEDVPEAALQDPQLLHAYAYAGNNPVALQDPDGRFVMNKAGSTLFRQLRPFSDQATGNYTDTKLERRARVFGVLQFKKGEAFPDAGIPHLPVPFQTEANKLKLEESLKPNALISKVTKVAQDLMSKFPEKGKGALNASAFVKRLTREGKGEGDTAFLGMIPGFLKTGDFSNSPITEGGKIVEEKAAKDIERLQNTVKSMDLNAKFKELIGKVNKSGKIEFQFDQKKVDEFIDKYMNLDPDAEEQNREKKQEEEKNEDE